MSVSEPSSAPTTTVPGVPPESQHTSVHPLQVVTASCWRHCASKNTTCPSHTGPFNDEVATTNDGDVVSLLLLLLPLLLARSKAST